MRVLKVFDPGLEHPVEGDEADERERGQQNHTECLERGAETGRRRHQPERDHPG